MKAILSIALVVCLVSMFYTQAQEIECPNRPPKEGEDAILIPDPTNCKHYFVCDYGRLILMECPGDMHFNPIEKICDFSWKAGCTAN
ncbi:Chitin-binding type-2 domain-containing protein [Camponotus japonicus]